MGASRGFAALPFLSLLLLLGCASRPPAAPRTAATPGMLLVGEGRFTMGRDEGEINEQPSHGVDLREYALDRTEVTAAEFAEFLTAAGNEGDRYFTPDEQATVVAVPGRGGERARFAARPGYERHPANNVSWHGADAYCRWRGKRLPTEAEWEKGARGPDERIYPWGDEPPAGSLARFGQSWPEQRLDVLLPVDSLAPGASPYGLLHMAGNVLEWVHDWYRQNLCDFCNPEREPNLPLIRAIAGQEEPGQEAGSGTASAPAPAGTGAGPAVSAGQAPPRKNPAGPATGGFKVLRGGSWRELRDDELTATRRYWLDPAQRFAHTGFRCAKDETRAQETQKP